MAMDKQADAAPVVLTPELIESLRAQARQGKLTDADFAAVINGLTGDCPAPGGGVTPEIREKIRLLQELRLQGVLDDKSYFLAKKRLLSGDVPPTAQTNLPRMDGAAPAPTAPAANPAPAPELSGLPRMDGAKAAPAAPAANPASEPDLSGLPRMDGAATVKTVPSRPVPPPDLLGLPRMPGGRDVTDVPLPPPQPKPAAPQPEPQPTPARPLVWGSARSTIAAGGAHSVALKADGSLLAAGTNFSGQCSVYEIRGAVAVAAGESCTLALLNNGAVMVIGFLNGDVTKSIGGRSGLLPGWEQIIAIAAKGYRAVGLRADGRVLALGVSDAEQNRLGSWRDIVAVASGTNHTVGLRRDGTVAAVGSSEPCKVGAWTNIVAVAAGLWHTVGLRSDGTVVTAGYSNSGTPVLPTWRNIVAIAAGEEYTVGLKANGTVVAAGKNNYGQCDVFGWRDVVAIAAGKNHTLGLRSDGTLLATGKNKKGQCEIYGWSGVRLP